MEGYRIPGATYRVQFNSGFRLGDARELVPYLQTLGITDLYASPVFTAVRGSSHGYDVTDPGRINPELGGEEAFSALADTLRRCGMGLILDIVPNHMAASSENPWWADILRQGTNSPYSPYFDIDWHPPRRGLAGKVLLPVLGATYGDALAGQELVLALAEEGLYVAYHDSRFPLAPKSYADVLNLEELARNLGPDHPAASQLGSLLGASPGPPDGRGGGPNGQDGRDGRAVQDVRRGQYGQAGGNMSSGLRTRLWQLCSAHPEIRAWIDDRLKTLNGQKGRPDSFDRLHEILEQQAYRLAFWRMANWEINYRRFFDTNGLASVRQEDRRVFDDTHALILRLASEGRIAGVRVDHVDGLRDPETYLRWLQDSLAGAGAGARPGFYVVVEKILSGDEEIPPGWPVCGTTGYDFLKMVNGLFVDVRGASGLDRLYARLAGSDLDFDTLVYEQKLKVMRHLFAGEMRSLAERLVRLADRDRQARDLSLVELEQALVEATACLPVYRTYIRDLDVSARDRDYIEEAVAAAGERGSAAPLARVFLRRVLLLEIPASVEGEDRRAWLEFIMRWQQFTGPIMAKGYEDTTLYIYHRLVSLNEVGGEPESLGVSVADFHRRNRARRQRWPCTMNTTSTHDTKRSEDVRARINVLSEIPQVWAGCIGRWREWNRRKIRVANGEPVPDPNFEKLVYETLVGAWPLDEREVPEFMDRLEGYLIKATREAKVHTSWLEPNPAYEEALVGFARSIVEPEEDNEFLPDFLRLWRFAAYYGALNSLSQVLLKITSPGVPDFYQGTELWDFSLVDPDNRRPVDFAARARLLSELQGREGDDSLSLPRELLSSWEDGRVKLYLTYKALRYRRDRAKLFAEGDYLPVDAIGPNREHVCAFMRRHAGVWAMVVVPRLVAGLQIEAARLQSGARSDHRALRGTLDDLPTARPPLGRTVWGETSLVLPDQAPVAWHNVLTGQTVRRDGGPTTACAGSALPVAAVLDEFPVALLEGEE